MQRVQTTPRVNWQKSVTDLGYDFHTPAGTPHWNESAYYVLNQNDVDRLANAARELHQMYIAVVQNTIDGHLFPLLGIEPALGRKITETWDADIPTILGRFDFMYDGVNEPKLLEYNADTPGNLFETAILQQNWREQRFPDDGQYNGLTEALINRFHELQIGRYDANRLHVTANGAIAEDVENVRFIAACAAQAGYTGRYFPIEMLGVDRNTGFFYDDQDQQITQVFKQYGWDFFAKDKIAGSEARYFDYIDYSKCWWLEPLWKMAFQCKGLLPALWDMYPEHQNLLPAFSDAGMIPGSFVKKPLWGRQGANIQIVINDKIVDQTSGQAVDGGYIYQGYYQAPVFDGYRPIFGVWIVTDQPCAIGIREDTGLITKQTSRFVPHIVK